MGIKKHIPNTITCLNLISGSVACVLALNHQYFYASLAIYAASVFDFFDGMAAPATRIITNRKRIRLTGRRHQFRTGTRNDTLFMDVASDRCRARQCAPLLLLYSECVCRTAFGKVQP